MKNIFIILCFLFLVSCAKERWLSFDKRIQKIEVLAEGYHLKFLSISKVYKDSIVESFTSDFLDKKSINIDSLLRSKNSMLSIRNNNDLKFNIMLEKDNDSVKGDKIKAFQFFSKDLKQEKQELSPIF